MVKSLAYFNPPAHENEGSDIPETRNREVSGMLSGFELGNYGEVRSRLRQFPALEPYSNPLDLQYTLFLSALEKRLHELDHTLVPGTQSLYLVDFEYRQIDLFNLLARKMPLVSMAAKIANRLLANEIRSGDDVTLLDIGIGTGRQEVELLEHLHSAGVRPRSLEIIGVEPAAEALAQAETGILQKARELDMPVSFLGIEAFMEQLPERVWSTLRRPQRKLLVNEAFALHHAHDPSGARDAKQEVLRQVKLLNPALFVLSEPDSNHETSDFAIRYQNAWKHFGLVFSVIDRLDLTAEEKGAMKSFFFGREITDVLSADENARSERHESSLMWRQRLSRAGFSPARNELRSVAGPSSDAPGVVEVELRDAIHLTHEGQSIVSLLAVR